MSAIWWILLLASLVVLSGTLGAMTLAARRYWRGDFAGAARGARGMGLTALAMGLTAVVAAIELAVSASNPTLFGIGIGSVVLASVTCGLGELSRKPVPSVYVAWTALVTGCASLVASFLF